MQWQLPAGLQAGEIAWPLPKKIPIGTLANYGYEGTVLLPVAVTVGPEFKAPIVGAVKIQLVECVIDHVIDNIGFGQNAGAGVERIGATRPADAQGGRYTAGRCGSGFLTRGRTG